MWTGGGRGNGRRRGELGWCYDIKRSVMKKGGMKKRTNVARKASLVCSHGGGGEELKMLFYPRPLNHMTISAVAEHTVDSGLQMSQTHLTEKH